MGASERGKLWMLCTSNLDKLAKIDSQTQITTGPRPKKLLLLSQSFRQIKTIKTIIHCEDLKAITEKL